MKHSPLFALMLMAGVLTTACAQLENSQNGDEWSPKAENKEECSEGSDATCEESSKAADAIQPATGMVNSVQAIPSGVKATSALLLTKSLPASVQRNEEFHYLMMVENLSQDPLANVVLEERLPEGLTLIGSEPAMVSNEGSVAVWNLGTLNGGASQTIKINGKAAADGISESFASVSYDRTLKGQFVVVSPDLQLEMHAPATTIPGENFNLELVLRNAGSGVARNVNLSAVLPEGLVTESGEDSAKLVLQELGAGESHTMTIPVQANRPGSFAATAQASLPKGEPISVTGAAIQAQDTRLELATSGPSKFFLGQPGKVTLTVKNVGSSLAKDVKLEQPLPEGLELVRASSPAERTENLLSWALGDLEAGAESSITLHLTPSQTGTLALAASAQASKGSAATSEFSAPMEGISALHFTIEDLQDPVPVGESLTYHIKVHNQGTAPGANIAIMVTMDEGMQLVHAKGPTNGRTEGNKILFNALDSLDPGATATWRLVLQSRQIGDLRLSAALTSKRLQRPVEVTQSTQFYE
ncbi:MAG: DUF11 domain-containing protein [Planctomycetota bacterium]|nr:DUF11 domain-containing protein [Planctomycetota bacterium]